VLKYAADSKLMVQEFHRITHLKLFRVRMDVIYNHFVGLLEGPAAEKGESMGCPVESLQIYPIDETEPTLLVELHHDWGGRAYPWDCLQEIGNLLRHGCRARSQHERRSRRLQDNIGSHTSEAPGTFVDHPSR
jgi:hypothetical protein